MIILDWELERQREIERRSRMLGELRHLARCEYENFVLRSRQTGIPPKFLIQWRDAFRDVSHSLFENELIQLDNESWRTACERWHQLQLDNNDTAIAVIYDEEFSTEWVEHLQEKNDWSIATARRWIQRGRAGGLWGLAPGRDPFVRRQQEQDDRPDLSELTAEEQAQIQERLALLGPLAHQAEISNAEMEERAAQLLSEGNPVSVRTLRGIQKTLREKGVKGLRKRQRSDHNTYKNLSPRMVEIVRMLRLTIPLGRVAAIVRQAEGIALRLGENAPNRHQVKRIIADIPAPTLSLADGHGDEYNSDYRATAPIRLFGDIIVYQGDQTQLDVLVKDLRGNKRSKSGEVRPYLTIFEAARSRLMLAWILSYDRPNRHTVAAALRMALMRGGIPDEFWFDQGNEFLANHVRDIIKEVNSYRNILPPYSPQLKGRVESLIKTIKTRLIEILPGYIGSNTQERPDNARASLSISELCRIITSFIRKYNTEPHSALNGSSPMEFWDQHCAAETRPVNPEHLNVLLMEGTPRVVSKNGIQYDTNIYVNPNLSSIVNETVVVRSPVPYGIPDYVEVFRNRRHFCTAYLRDSEYGQELTSPESIGMVKAAQRQQYKAPVDEAKNAIENLKAGIGDWTPLADRVPSPSPEQPASPTEQKQSASKPRKPKRKDNKQSSEGDLASLAQDPDEFWNNQ